MKTSTFLFIALLFPVHFLFARTSLNETVCTKQNSIAVVPIQLVHFTATLNAQNNVDLTWSTGVEINNDFFTVEKTADGANYETVLVIEGAGSSSQPLNYSCVDYSPYSGVSYYRLKQTDVNGYATYSEIETVVYEPDTDFALELSPNPGDGSAVQLTVNAEADQEIRVVFYDASGKACHSEQMIAGNSGLNYYCIEFPETLVPGIYLVTVITSGANQETAPAYRKIIVQ